MARIQDPAELETDAIIAEIEQRLKVEYAQAQREIAQKVEDYYRRYEIKLQTWQKWVAEGKKTKAEFQQWKIGQLAIGKRWEDLRDQLAHDLYNTNQIAHSIARGYMPDVYALNHNYATFECEAGSGVDTSYTLYSREAVENIFRDNPQMLPDPGKRVSQEIAEGKAIRWNNRHLQSVMMQALLQGNNISDIATRLANAVGDSDRKAAIRNARTMATGTQNRARRDAYTRAKNKGIDVKVMWLATLDMRTRHSHRQMDKMQTDVDKPFVLEDEVMGHVSIMYPGQPKPGGETKFPQEMIWNCRCTLRAVVAGLERRSGTSGDTDLSQIEGMSYEEWKASKIEKTKNILRPDWRADEERADYIREYRGYDGDVPSGRDMSLDIDARKQFANAAPNGSQAWRHIPTGEARPLEDTMSKAMMARYNKQLRGAPESILKLHDTYRYGVGYVNLDVQSELIKKKVIDGAMYNDGTVYYDKPISLGLSEFSVLNHESGHAFDHAMDGHVDGVEFTELAKLNRILYGDDGPETFRPSKSDAFMAAVRKDAANLWDIIEFGNDDWEVFKKKLWTYNPLKDEDLDASWGVQDFIDGLLGKAECYRRGIIVRWKHGDDYYNRGYDDLNMWSRQRLVDMLSDEYGDADEEDARRYMREWETASELWANIQSALTAGGEEEAYMRRYAGNAVEAFLDIIGRV